MDGERTGVPDTWSSSDDGLHCLICRRERAADQAIASAPSDSPVEVRAEIRRAALIEFEVRRNPDHPDGVIARTCRSSAPAVAKALASAWTSRRRTRKRRAPHRVSPALQGRA